MCKLAPIHFDCYPFIELFKGHAIQTERSLPARLRLRVDQVHPSRHKHCHHQQGQHQQAGLMRSGVINQGTYNSLAYPYWRGPLTLSQATVQQRCSLARPVGQQKTPLPRVTTAEAKLSSSVSATTAQDQSEGVQTSSSTDCTHSENLFKGHASAD